MHRSNLIDRHRIKRRLEIRTDPWRGIECALKRAGKSDQPAPGAVVAGKGAIKREIALRAFQDRAIRHDAGMAHRARKDADPYSSLLVYHVTVEGPVPYAAIGVPVFS